MIRTSIVIPFRNQWKLTGLCLRFLRKYTRLPHEIVLVDNGSTEKYVPPNDVQLIRNRYNQGFAAAVNQGLERASGEFLVVLNNDTLPGARWIEQMIAVFDQRKDCGLVGPVSNKVIPEQKIPVNLPTIRKIEEFTAKYNRSNPKKWKSSKRISGFCMVFPRHVFQKVGFFDERFGLGTYEDDDYCLRVRRAGFECIITGDTYVHHFGSQSFRKRGYAEFKKILRQNRRYFLQKWGLKSY
jgi:GT2 family glycosyltransferase